MQALSTTFALLAVLSASTAPVAMAAEPVASASAQEADPRPGPPPRERDPKFEAALSACRESSGARDGDRPDRAKIDACMSAKGFERPKAPPPGARGDRPPPERDGDAS